MKLEPLARFILGLCFLLSVTGSSAAQSSRRASLAGLTSIGVLVEPLSKEVEKAGLHAEAIQTDTELSLRKSRVEVNESSVPYLYVTVQISESRDIATLFVYSILVELFQPTLLERDQRIRTFATTWRSGSSGVAGSNRLSFVRERIAECVDQFINDYLAANPRQK
jgi:hypothetical protein